MSVTYEQARADHEYLWSAHRPANDMTGGHVDQDDLAKLLRSPTKATARDIYSRQIAYWFEVGPEREGTLEVAWKTDPKVREIAIRHWCEDSYMALLHGDRYG